MSDVQVDETVNSSVQQAIKDQPSQTTTQVDKDEQQAVTELIAGQGKASIQARIYSPFRDYYDGWAYSLTAENATGRFDILPRHHNFMSLLSPCEVIIRTVNEGERHIKISGGLLHVRANQITIFLDV